MTMTIEEAKREIEKITPELARLRSLSDRLGLLQNFVALGERLANPIAEVVAAVETVRPAEKLSGRTAGLAYEILSEANSPLHIMEIVKAARLKGWGKGEDLADEGSMYAALHRNPNKFVSMGKKTWKLPERFPRTTGASKTAG